MAYKDSEIGRMERLLEIAHEIIALKNSTNPMSKSIMKNKITTFAEKLSQLDDPDFEDLKNAMQEVINRRNLK